MKDNIKFYFFIFLFFSAITVQAGQKAPLKAKDFISENTLHDAVRSSDIDVVKYLVNQGIKINNVQPIARFVYKDIFKKTCLLLFRKTTYLILRDLV